MKHILHDITEGQVHNLVDRAYERWPDDCPERSKYIRREAQWAGIRMGIATGSITGGTIGTVLLFLTGHNVFAVLLLVIAILGGMLLKQLYDEVQ